jgi:hypothetical protein
MVICMHCAVMTPRNTPLHAGRVLLRCALCLDLLLGRNTCDLPSATAKHMASMSAASSLRARNDVRQAC